MDLSKHNMIVNFIWSIQFINLENILPVSKALIKYGPIGSYPNIEKLLAFYGLESSRMSKIIETQDED